MTTSTEGLATKHGGSLLFIPILLGIAISWLALYTHYGIFILALPIGCAIGIFLLGIHPFGQEPMEEQENETYNIRLDCLKNMMGKV